jgi:hypothetical protein
VGLVVDDDRHAGVGEAPEQLLGLGWGHVSRIQRLGDLRRGEVTAVGGGTRSQRVCECAYVGAGLAGCCHERPSGDEERALAGPAGLAHGAAVSRWPVVLV